MKIFQDWEWQGGASGMTETPIGTSKAAQRRFARANRGTLYRGHPGDVIEMFDRVYVVAKDGSFRFQAMRKKGNAPKAYRAEDLQKAEE